MNGPARRNLAVSVVLLLLAVVGGTPAVSLARFTVAPTSSGSFGTATLQPPTAVSGTGGTSASLAWTASTSTGATGYQLLRSATSGSGYTQVKTVTPVSAAATTDAPGNGTWYYVLRTYVQSWTSALSSEVRIVIGRTSTGYKGCAGNAADAGQGDGNGYELIPGNACASDGTYATDAGSGTNNSTSCSNAGKDKHQFWGYSFGLPASVTSIDGITVQVIAGTTTSSATYGICVAVSGDGGATWSANVPVTFATNAVTTYTFGAATDTWGLAWTTGNLSPSSFRVRITDVGSTTTKTFLLDYVGVSVTYTP